MATPKGQNLTNGKRRMSLFFFLPEIVWGQQGVLNEEKGVGTRDLGKGVQGEREGW